MSPLVTLGIGVGAGLGAILRAGAERVQGHLLLAGHARFGARWFLTPGWSTLVVNVVGSGLFGVLAGLVSRGRVDDAWFLILGAGFLGGLTTFSTLGLELFESITARRWGIALTQAACQILLGIGSAILGFHLAG